MLACTRQRAEPLAHARQHAELPPALAKLGSAQERIAALEALLGDDAVCADALDAEDIAQLEPPRWDGPLPMAAAAPPAAHAEAAPAAVRAPAAAPQQPLAAAAPAPPLAAAAATSPSECIGTAEKGAGFLLRAGYDFPSLVGRSVQLLQRSGRWRAARVAGYSGATRTLTLAWGEGGGSEAVSADEAAQQGTLNVLRSA